MILELCKRNYFALSILAALTLITLAIARMPGNALLALTWLILALAFGGLYSLFLWLQVARNSRRKEHEADVRANEVRQARTLAVARIGAWEYDPRTGSMWWSPEMYSLLHFDRSQEPPDFETLLRRFPAEEVRHRRRAFSRIVRSGEPFAVDLRFQLPNGTICWFHVFGQRLEVSDGVEGMAGRYIGTVQDITERKLLEERLRVSEERLSLAMDATEDALWDWEIATGKLTVNRQWLVMLGYSEAEFPQHVSFWRSLFHPDERGEADERLRRMMEGHVPAYGFEHRLLRQNGEWLWVLGRAKVVERDSTGKALRVIGTKIDISERKLQEDALRESRERFRLAISAMHDGLLVLNGDGEIEIGNQRAQKILELAVDGESGRLRFDPEMRVVNASGVDLPEEEQPATQALAIGTASRNVLLGVRKRDRDPIWLNVNAEPLFPNDLSRSHAAVVTFTDVTERRRLEEEQARLMRDAIERADHDPLTDLYNHRTFHFQLRKACESALADGGSVAVLVMDLDNFKFFNDTYGHLVGDEVLCRVANVLRANCRENDILARIGGDEFAILLPRADQADARECAARLRKTVHALTFTVPGEETVIPLRLSVGISVVPEETHSYAEAVYNADKRAMLDKEGEQVEAASDTLRASLRVATEGFAMLDALVAALDHWDRYTRRHSEDVMVLSGLIAREMGLSEDEVRSLEVAALIHDVGKIGVPIRLLRQPSKLAEADFRVIRQHPVLGAVLAGAFPELTQTLSAIRHHHERWDGGGYPDGLAGENIPLEARIMAVADAFSAMTTDRPYRVSMEASRALGILEECAGSQLDPQCVGAFARAARRQFEGDLKRALQRRSLSDDSASEGSTEARRTA